MHHKEKKKLRELLMVIVEAATAKSFGQTSGKTTNHILDSITLILEILEQETIRPANTLGKLTALQAILAGIREPSFKRQELKKHCDSLLQSFDAEVEARFKVVFFPYKASMWDSLESVYFAARDDASCDVEVVPIPYYELSEDKAEATYEGDLFPAGIPITHYRAYNLETERPDIIYVHNIYDQYNTLTRVFEEYYTVNLKKHTDMLVFVPYGLYQFIPPKSGSNAEKIGYGMPAVKNIDKFVFQGKYLSNAALKYGIPPNKPIALGSPKIDRLINAFRQSIKLPKLWYPKVEGKTVFLLDTHLLFFATSTPFDRLEMLIKLLNIPNMVNDTVLIWRPHPLMKTSLKKYNPYLLDYYVRLVEESIGKGEYCNVIFDDSQDYLPAIAVSQIYIGDLTSLMYLSLIAGREIVLVGEKLPDDALVPHSEFHYLINSESNWLETFREIASKTEFKAKDRSGILEGVYENMDGTSGAKIHEFIRQSIFNH